MGGAGQDEAEIWEVAVKLWLLRPISVEGEPWKPWYDKCFGMVVRAESEHAAREIATANGAEESDRNGWGPEWSTCVELTADGDRGVVIADEHWA